MTKQKPPLALGKRLTTEAMKQLQGGTLMLSPLFLLALSDGGPTMVSAHFMLTASSANP